MADELQVPAQPTHHDRRQTAARTRGGVVIEERGDTRIRPRLFPGFADDVGVNQIQLAFPPGRPAVRSRRRRRPRAPAPEPRRNCVDADDSARQPGFPSARPPRYARVRRPALFSARTSASLTPRTCRFTIRSIHTINDSDDIIPCSASETKSGIRLDNISIMYFILQILRSPFHCKQNVEQSARA